MVSSFGFDHDVVNVGLNGPPDEVSEALEHTTLVHSPSVLQTEWHCDLAEQSEGGCKENGPQAQLLWILVFDDQHNQVGLMNLQVIVL